MSAEEEWVQTHILIIPLSAPSLTFLPWTLLLSGRDHIDVFSDGHHCS